MRQRTCILIAFASFLFGLFVGGFLMAGVGKRVSNQLVIGSLASDANASVVVLRRLRAGNSTNAEDALESRLDGDLVCLGAFDPRELKRTKSTMDALTSVEAYRKVFPHTSTFPEVDQKIEKTLRSFHERNEP